MRTDMRGQLTSMLEEYRSVRARIDRLCDDAATMTATARSTDGCVTAVVGPQGELRDLRIDPEVARRLDLRTLAARVLEASGAAGAEARQRLGRTLAELMPSHLRHLVSPDGDVDVRGLLPSDFTSLLPNGMPESRP
jgi:DNA-binding protein YbaB